MTGGEIAASIAGKIAEILVGRAVDAISPHFSYLFCYKRNFQNLRNQLTELELRRVELQQSVTEARWNLETIAPTVWSCLDRAGQLKERARIVECRASEVEKGCLINLKKLYILSRKATMLIEEIGVFKQEFVNHARFSHPPPPVGIVDPSSTTNEQTVIMTQLEGRDRKKGKEKKGKAAFSKGTASTSLTQRPVSMSFITRLLTMQKVMDALMDDRVNMIGLSGMGGIGKTTLVYEVREKIKARNLFSEVAQATVSQNPDFLRIQGELADMLGLKYQELTSVVARAERLRERLTKGGRVLVILDDIWDGIKLDRVGIPVCKSCKIIFTTRIEQACIEMGAQANIKVSVLSDLESWELFKEMTGDCVENKDIEGIARKVAKECGGLPLAIKTLGTALAGKAQHVWKDALHQLKMSAGRNIPGMHGKVHSSIALSYEFLGSSQAQSLLLLCCLFKEDANIPIEQLIRYGIGLQLFDDVETMERTRSRVYSLVDHLKSSSLLLDVGTEPLFQEEMFVKLHDIVRDVCLSIASREPRAYLVRHDRHLKQWPHNDTPNPHTAISLMSDVMDELPGGLVYPNLKLLQLQLKRNSVNVSREFFHGMEAVRVLDFQEWSFGGISDCLPETLEFLANLRTLSLEHCTVCRDISVIGRLQKLEVLSFFMSSLDNLPTEVGQLTNLKVLDLRCENEAPVIRTSILSRLHNLEELYMGHYDSWEGSTEEQREGYCTSITELDSLPCLTTLQIQVRNPRLLLKLKDFCFRQLQRFNISTQRMRLPDRYGIINSLYLKDVDSEWLIETNFLSLVSRSENLFLIEMKMRYILSQHLSVKRLSLRRSDEPKFYGHAMDAFPNLELLHIEEMIHLIEISHPVYNPAGSFVRLRELELSELPDLRNLWSGPVHPPSFGNLKFVQISRCKALRSLFTHDRAKCLVKLQDLFIFYGDEMEGAISDEGRGDNNEINRIMFPKLNHLWFDCLPKFRSFYPVSGIEVSGDNNRATIQSLFNQQVWLPNLDMVQISDLHSLKQIVSWKMKDRGVHKLRVIKVKNCHRLLNITDSTLLLQNLGDVVVEGCKEIESVFDLEGLKDMEQNAPVILDNLETIELNDLPRLTHIWKMVPKEIKGFQNLRTLDIWACHSLRYILPLPIAKKLVNLHDLTLGLCDAMELVIDGEEEDSSALVFPQLQVLKLLSLNMFISFSSSSINFEFPLLQKVEITKCPNMTNFCCGLVNAPIIEGPVEDPDINEWIWEGNLNNGINRGIR